MKSFINLTIKILKYILIVLVLLISFLLINNFIQLKILKNDYPKLLNHSFFIVVTNSMAPTIQIDDLIIVNTKADIKLEDVITYKKKGVFITHRVTSIKDKHYLTKGDANNIGDEAVTKDLVVGKVVKIIPKVGVWQKVIMTPQVFILLIITLLLFNDSFKDWTKYQYHRFRDFRITKDSIIEEKDEKKKRKK